MQKELLVRFTRMPSTPSLRSQLFSWVHLQTSACSKPQRSIQDKVGHIIWIYLATFMDFLEQKFFVFYQFLHLLCLRCSVIMMPTHHYLIRIIFIATRRGILIEVNESYSISSTYIYVTVNLRNQIFPGIPNLLRESWESLKCIEIPRNLWNRPPVIRLG